MNDQGTPSRDGTRTVVLEDESLLSGLSEIKGHLDRTSGTATAVLVIDLSRLDRLSSATLAAMLWARRTCHARGGHVVVRSPNRHCRGVLKRTGLSALFDIRSTSSG